MGIDQVIDRFEAVWAAADLPPTQGPAADVETVLADIAAAIAPMKLPTDVLAFWRRVDAESLAHLAPYPQPTSPSFALRCWLEHEEGGKHLRMTPRLLFPVAYQSHGFTFVELLRPGNDTGGALFDWAYAGMPFTLTHPDLPTYLDQWTSLIESRSFLREPRPDGSERFEFDPENRWAATATERLEGHLPLPGYGQRSTIEEDMLEWPEHWLVASGYTAGGQDPLGADTTIAALRALTGNGVPGRGTVHARVEGNGSKESNRVTIDDGTGRLLVRYPNRLETVLKRSELMEFELVVRAARVPTTPRGNNLEADVESEFFYPLYGTPPEGVALAIRPLA